MTKTIYIDAKYNKEIKLSEELINYLKKNNVANLALFASAQFLELEKATEQLKQEGIRTIATKTKRTEKPTQLLGCNIYHDNFDEDIIEGAEAILYIGDGTFHPKALLLSQIKNLRVKSVITFNPISRKVAVMTRDAIEEQVTRIKRNIKLFANADTIGILVSVKLGQQYLAEAKKLRDNLNSKGKKAYIFIDNNFTPAHFENFSFIKAWVNSACPRIATDDIQNIRAPIINIRDAFEPEKALEEMG